MEIPRLESFADNLPDVLKMKALTISLFMLALLTGMLGQARTAPQATAAARTVIDVSKLGPQVRQRVPDFRLKDQNDKEWTLGSIMGSKGAMLVFFRSAGW